jgi:hypothetical protein
MKKWNLVILISAVILLTACSNMPLSTMYKMIRLDPLDIDPRQLVVAVRVPEGMKVRHGDIVINFAFQTEQPNVSFSHKFLVQVNSDYSIPEELTKDIHNSEHITILQLSKDDALAMYNGQQVVKSYRVDHEDGAGSFGLKIESACRDENFSLNDAKLDVYVKLKNDEEFFTFTEDLELIELNADMQGAFKKLPNCSNV